MKTCSLHGGWRLAAGVLAGLLATAILSLAQPLPDALITSATVLGRSTQNDLAYMAWNPTQPGLLEAKLLAVYAKPGGTDSLAPFTRRSIIARPVSAADMAPFLDLASQLGFDPDSLRDILGYLAQQTTGTIPQLLEAVLARAQADHAVADNLDLLAGSHPALSLVLGRAWAGSIDAGQTTFELRLLDPSTQQDLGVVGRVTVTAGLPVLLPAPEAPVQIPDHTLTGDLNIKLRWDQSRQLRARLPLSGGFNVWRMSAAFARSHQLDTQRQTFPEILALATQGEIERITDAPVLPPANFDDHTRLFLIDDHNRYVGQRAFTDGEEVAYIVTAGDLLGRDGLPSLAGFGTACRTFGPSAPRDFRLSTATELPAGGGPPFDDQADTRQFFRLTWLANTNAPPDEAQFYEVYRGMNLGELSLTNDPPPANLVAIVPHLAGTVSIDTTNRPLPEADFYGRTLWFSIRAGRVNACGDKIFSPMTPPALATLRQYRSPNAPTGVVAGNCAFPAVVPLAGDLQDLEIPDSVNYRGQMVCRRRSHEIVWAEFYLAADLDLKDTQPLGRYYFGERDDAVATDWSLPRTATTTSMVAVCRVGTLPNGEGASDVAIQGFDLNFGANRTRSDIFEAGIVSADRFDPSDPLYQVFGQCRRIGLQGTLLTPTVVSTNGTLGFLLPELTNRLYALQARQTGTTVGFPWATIGAGRIDLDGWLWVYAPALVQSSASGALYEFRGFSLCDPPGGCDGSFVPRLTGDPVVRDLKIRLKLTARTREWRVFRRVNDSELSLIAQGTDAFDAAKVSNEIITRDDAPPLAGVRVCYFAQTFDEHGNASPLAQIGDCLTIDGPPPVPVVAPLEAVGDRSNARMLLKWFCPAFAVERFTITVAVEDTADSGANKLASKLTRLAVKPVFLRGLLVTNVRELLLVRKASLESVKLTAGPLHYDTPRVGGEIGAGPDFTFELPVVPQTRYVVYITAKGPGQFSSGPSAPQEFIWKQPTPPEQVPWPERPLPGVVKFHPDIRAVRLPRETLVVPTNAASAVVGVRIGRTPGVKRSDFSTSTPGFEGKLVMAFADNKLAPKPDFNAYLFHDELGAASRGGETILPVVLYRQQITNDTFPKVSGDVIQVSPLVRRIVQQAPGNYAVPLLVLRDPFIAATYFAPSTDYSFPLELYLLDTHPVQQNAVYHYWLARFRQDGELDVVVDAGEVPEVK